MDRERYFLKRQKEIKFDSIGYWSEVKLDIVKEYAAAYSLILSSQKYPTLSHAYIDAFAGSGVHISRKTGEFIPGSPLNALLVEPPFRDYYLIDNATVYYLLFASQKPVASNIIQDIFNKYR